MNCESFRKLSLDKYKIIHFEGLRNPLEIRKMIAFIRKNDIKRKIKISLELERNCNDLKVLLSEDIDLFFVESSFAKLFGFENSQQTIEGISKLVHSKALVICPWAETGAKAIDNCSQKICSSPAFTPKNGVVDTLGAGDTFVATTLFALWILNYDLKDAIVLGCQVAGSKCGKFGFQHLHEFQKYI